MLHQMRPGLEKDTNWQVSVQPGRWLSRFKSSWKEMTNEKRTGLEGRQGGVREGEGMVFLVPWNLFVPMLPREACPLPLRILHRPLRCALHLLGNSWTSELTQIFTELLGSRAGLTTVSLPFSGPQFPHPSGWEAQSRHLMSLSYGEDLVSWPWQAW